MSNLISHVGLVSQSVEVSAGQTAMIAAALQKQITRDFSPVWDIQATVDSFARVEDIPPGYWPILIRDELDAPGAAGVHLDRNGQPYALVRASEGTPLTCSHELLEMLADPFGSRFVAGDSIKPGQNRVKYLVEICDPSEAAFYGYTVNGIRVSDFYTPHFFDPVKASGVRYSYTGAITKPRQVLQGGYLSWMEPATGAWWQANYFGTRLAFTGPHKWKRKDGQSWREVVDAHTRQPLKKLQGPLLAASKSPRNHSFCANRVAKSSTGWAKGFMEEVEARIRG